MFKLIEFKGQYILPKIKNFLIFNDIFCIADMHF